MPTTFENLLAAHAEIRSLRMKLATLRGTLEGTQINLEITKLNQISPRDYAALTDDADRDQG